MGNSLVSKPVFWKGAGVWRNGEQLARGEKTAKQDAIDDDGRWGLRDKTRKVLQDCAKTPTAQTRAFLRTTRLAITAGCGMRENGSYPWIVSNDGFAERPYPAATSSSARVTPRPRPILDLSEAADAALQRLRLFRVQHHAFQSGLLAPKPCR